MIKPLSEVFIIVNDFESLSSFYTDNVSLDRKSLEVKCSEMNDEFNLTIKNNTSRFEKFKVMTLSEATEKFHDDCIDYYSEQDESY
jgi:hypothetical protein